MPLVVNGVTIPDGGEVYVNGTKPKTINVNGTKVWEDYSPMLMAVNAVGAGGTNVDYMVEALPGSPNTTWQMGSEDGSTYWARTIVSQPEQDLIAFTTEGTDIAKIFKMSDGSLLHEWTGGDVFGTSHKIGSIHGSVLTMPTSTGYAGADIMFLDLATDGITTVTANIDSISLHGVRGNYGTLYCNGNDASDHSLMNVYAVDVDSRSIQPLDDIVVPIEPDGRAWISGVSDDERYFLIETQYDIAVTSRHSFYLHDRSNGTNTLIKSYNDPDRGMALSGRFDKHLCFVQEGSVDVEIYDVESLSFVATVQASATFVVGLYGLREFVTSQVGADQVGYLAVRPDPVNSTSIDKIDFTTLTIENNAATVDTMYETHFPEQTRYTISI